MQFWSYNSSNGQCYLLVADKIGMCEVVLLNGPRIFWVALGTQLPSSEHLEVYFC